MDIPPQQAVMLVLVLVLGLGCNSYAEISPVVHRRISSVDGRNRGESVSASVGFKLYCVAPTTENLAFSPYSVAAGLSMLLLGSRGESAVELGTALGLGGSSADLSVHQSIGQLSTVPPSEVFKLTSADNLFIRESQPVLPVFLTTAQRAYGVSPVTMDFNRNPEKSRIDINSWVMQNTDGKIRDLLPQGSVSEVTQMVFVNAVYFAAKWASDFRKSSTHAAEFTKANGEKMTVDMMARTGTYNHGNIEALDAQVLEVPYSQRPYSMFFLVPNKGSSLQFLQSRFCTISSDAKQLMSIITAQMRESTVEVKLPKFTLESELPLSRLLSSIGVNSVFDPNRSDLSGIDGTRELFLSDALHKVHIEVDESGTTAAAATALRVSLRSLPEQFIIDRPFIFLIMNAENGVVLFMGHMHEPKA